MCREASRIGRAQLRDLQHIYRIVQPPLQSSSRSFHPPPPPRFQHLFSVNPCSHLSKHWPITYILAFFLYTLPKWNHTIYTLLCLVSFCVCVVSLVTQLCLTLFDLMGYNPPGASIHEDSPGKHTGLGSHALLQGIFPIQGSNPGLPHCRWILYHLSHQGSPKLFRNSF